MQPVLPTEVMHAAMQSAIYFITLIGTVVGLALAARG
jgi:hypothetical protein